MKKLLLISLLGQIFMTSALTAAVADINGGKEKFNSACAVCHGTNGERKALGISRIIANIGDSTLIKNMLTNIKNNGADSGKNMAMVNAASKLSDKDILNLSAFIAALKK